MPSWVRITTVVAVLLGAGVVVTAQAYPSLAATACPGCYELTEAAPGLYVEQGQDTRRAAQVAADARRRVAAFYGTPVSAPRLLMCATDACYRRIGGGGERGVAVLSRAVMLSPRGLDPVIAAHEMSHVELHARGGRVPQWFDEGLAVVVADDRRYLAPPDAADRCLVRTAEPLPATLGGWLKAATADPNVYAKAACRTSEWLAENGGRDGLLRRLASGTPINP